MKFLAGLATGSLIAAAMAFTATPAKAQFLGIGGKKKPKEDFSATLPAPVPQAPPANGGIFQVNDGYAALYEGEWQHPTVSGHG